MPIGAFATILKYFELNHFGPPGKSPTKDRTTLGRARTWISRLQAVLMCQSSDLQPEETRPLAEYRSSRSQELQGRIDATSKATGLDKSFSTSGELAMGVRL